jgi:hypothetical protein
MFDLRNLTLIEEKWLRPITLDQKGAAARLGITDRYLRELDEFWPPRTVKGSGHESRYEWPALMFWFFEYQIARASKDEWAFQNWQDKAYLLQRFRKAEERRNNLVGELRKARTSNAILGAARNLLSDD